MDKMKMWNVIGGEVPEDGRNVVWLSQLNPMFHNLMPTTLLEYEAVAYGGMPANGDGCGLRAWRYADEPAQEGKP